MVQGAAGKPRSFRYEADTNRGAAGRRQTGLLFPCFPAIKIDAPDQYPDPVLRSEGSLDHTIPLDPAGGLVCAG